MRYYDHHGVIALKVGQKVTNGEIKGEIIELTDKE